MILLLVLVFPGGIVGALEQAAGGAEKARMSILSVRAICPRRSAASTPSTT